MRNRLLSTLKSAISRKEIAKSSFSRNYSTMSDAREFPWFHALWEGMRHYLTIYFPRFATLLCVTCTISPLSDSAPPSLLCDCTPRLSLDRLLPLTAYGWSPSGGND